MKKTPYEIGQKLACGQMQGLPGQDVELPPELLQALSGQGHVSELTGQRAPHLALLELLGGPGRAQQSLGPPVQPQQAQPPQQPQPQPQPEMGQAAPAPQPSQPATPTTQAPAPPPEAVTAQDPGMAAPQSAPTDILSQIMQKRQLEDQAIVQALQQLEMQQMSPGFAQGQKMACLHLGQLAAKKRCGL